MEIKFHKFLYSVLAVKKAIQDYRNLADFSYQEKGDYIWVKISSVKEKASRLLFREEFSNYVLFLTGTLK